MHRKTFIKKTLEGVLLTLAVPSITLAKTNKDPKPISKKLAKEFVVAGHKNLPLVKEMLEEFPNLIYASYDWGASDFEEAIEGAAHLGNKDIANYLISKGARVNLFTHTMLGKTELVKATIETYPELLFAKGAHGFTLLHHAKMGEAKELIDYFNEKGLKETHIKIK